MSGGTMENCKTNFRVDHTKNNNNNKIIASRLQTSNDCCCSEKENRDGKHTVIARNETTRVGNFVNPARVFI